MPKRLREMVVLFLYLLPPSRGLHGVIGVSPLLVLISMFCFQLFSLWRPGSGLTYTRVCIDDDDDRVG